VTDARYKQPGWFTKYVFNKTVAAFTRLGVSVWGSRILEVKGRTTGVPRHVPVNLLTHDGVQFLLAPRGETQWVRNLRVAGDGVLILGRRRQPFTAIEVPVGERNEILRSYLKRWKAEVGVFFDGVSATSPDAEVERIAPDHPVFRLAMAGTAGDPPD